MVTMRSVWPMKLERMFSSVVLPAPVPPGHDDVEPARHGSLQEVQHRLGQRLPIDQILRTEPVRSKPADGQHRAIEGERRQ